MFQDHSKSFSSQHHADLERLDELHELKDELELLMQLGLSMARMGVPNHIAFEEVSNTLNKMRNKLNEFEDELFFDIAVGEVVLSLQEAKKTLHAHGG